jgi:hypothetical protein
MLCFSFCAHSDIPLGHVETSSRFIMLGIAQYIRMFQLNAPRGETMIMLLLVYRILVLVLYFTVRTMNLVYHEAINNMILKD